MLIQARYRDAIVNGEVTLTFRRWKRPQVVAGNTYRTAAGRIVVDAIEVVDPDRITNADARRAGFATRAELVGELRGPPELPTYRIRIRAAADLAATFGRETQPFKLDVRKLKNLGLTLSLEVGYRLSPRGEAYLAATQAL